MLFNMESRLAEVIASPVFVSQKMVVSTIKELWIPAHVREVKDGKMPAGDRIIMGHNNFAQITDLYPWSRLAVCCHEDGQVIVRVLNTLPHPVTYSRAPFHFFIGLLPWATLIVKALWFSTLTTPLPQVHRQPLGSHPLSYQSAIIHAACQQHLQPLLLWGQADDDHPSGEQGRHLGHL